MPAQVRLALSLFFVSLLPAGLAEGANQSTSRQVSPAGSVLNVRDFGAVGDGQLHRVTEWIESGRFRNLKRLRQQYPFIDNLDWSIDEVAFEAAKRSLPPEGGTIHFPVGHYVTGRHPWKIWRDNVRLTGDGAERTVLSTAPEIEDGMSVAPYRHVGWIEGANREYPFRETDGARGTDSLTLLDGDWSADFRPGDLVFIRNGANRYDQDYGEFNEIVRAEDGRLKFRYPFARDYTAARLNWAGELTADFAMSRPGRSGTVHLRQGEGYAVPRERATITIGTNLFRVDKASSAPKGQPVEVRVLNPGRGNAPKGTILPAGTKVAKSRSVIKVTRTARNFRCENLQIVGQRKTLVISNTWDTTFTDCMFVRDARARRFKGGITIDGDGGRFARFERCRIVAQPPAGMQFARSFGSVVFTDCTFLDANVAFTEFNFDCEVNRCRFEVQGGRELKNVVISGKSCGDLRFLDNQIRARGVSAVFDSHMDIQSFKHGSEGDFIIRGNEIETENVPRMFVVPKSDRYQVVGNSVQQR